MKTLCFSLLIFASMIGQACSSAPEQVSYAQQNKAASPTVSPTASPTAQTDSEASYLAADEDIVNRSGEIKMVFMGELDFKNGRIAAGKDWSVGEDKQDVELKKGMLFDVLTCAGFVAQAKLKSYHGEANASDDSYHWEMELVAGNASKIDAAAFLKCRAADGKPIAAFAVYPAKTAREKIKIQNPPDLSRVFDSLPARDKKWIASNDPENTGYSEEKKKTPDIDAWTDADGDGQIDLIEVSGTCNGQPDGELICRQILHFSNNQWTRVGWLATD